MHRRRLPALPNGLFTARQRPTLEAVIEAGFLKAVSRLGLFGEKRPGARGIGAAIFSAARSTRRSNSIDNPALQ
jgi:hypothetical protein